MKPTQLGLASFWATSPKMQPPKPNALIMAPETSPFLSGKCDQPALSKAHYMKPLKIPIPEQYINTNKCGPKALGKKAQMKLVPKPNIAPIRITGRLCPLKASTSLLPSGKHTVANTTVRGPIAIKSC